MLDKLRSVAGLVAVAGVFSIVLAAIGYNLKVLLWIDMWGEGVGWAIRVALLVGGAAAFFLLPAGKDEEEEEAAQEQP